jgi:PAS domain S-box-containing protein
MAAQNYSVASIFIGKDEMHTLMRNTDWSSMRLGSPETWPQSLCSTLSVCLNIPSPACIFWGTDYVLLYNDAWRKLLGDKHPQALGQPVRKVLPELWERFGAQLDQALNEHTTSQEENEPHPTSQCYKIKGANLDFNFSPILGEGGTITGVFASTTKSSQRCDDLPEGLADRTLRMEQTQSAQSESPGDQVPDHRAILEFAINHIHDVVYLTDKNTCILYSNDEASRVLGYSPKELQSLKVTDIDPDFSLTRWSAHWNKLRYQGSLVFESRHRNKSGQIFPVEITANHFEYGANAYNLALVRNLTDLKQSQSQHLEHFKFLESMDRVNQAIHGTNDLEQMMGDALDAVLSIYNADRAFFLYPCDPNAPFWYVPMERTKPEYPGAFQLGVKWPMDAGAAQALQVMLDLDGPMRSGPGNEYELPAAIAQKFDFKSFMAMAIRPKVGKPWQFGIHQCSYARVWTPAEATLYQEIGRRLADGLTSLLSYRNLQESEVKYRRIVDTANEGIWMLGADGVAVFVNARMAEMLGYSEEEMKGRPMTDFMSEEEVPGHLKRIENHHKGISEQYEGCFRRKDGKNVWALISTTPVFTSEDRFQGSFSMVSDITERRQAVEELRRYKDQLEETVQQRTSELLTARDAAEAANRTKSVFLANMSHELRTPINAILGFSNMMRREPQLSESQCESLDIINRSGEHLLSLIDDVLDIAKIEAGRLHLEIASFDLGNMARDVTNMMQQRAQEKDLQFLLDQSSAFPRYIKGDEKHLRQVLVNLASNAVKFTEIGGVTIRLGLKHDHQDCLLIEVEDTGLGIKPEDQKRLFKPFVQLTESGGQKGAGLGLAISHQLLELMGGSISVESTWGKGSLFRVQLPVETSTQIDVDNLNGTAQAGEVMGLKPGQPSYRILIAEDQPDNQLLLAKLMTHIGLEARVAENGLECLNLFQEWQPQLIWMDRRMPVMDGVVATQHIRELPGGQEVKIVAVTASVFKEQQQELFDAGMDDFIRKPYRFQEIYDCMAKHLGIQYIYRTDIPTTKAQPIAVTPAMLSVLPDAMRDELEVALEQLDGQQINSIIQQIGEIDAELAQALFLRTKDFDYLPILNALAMVKTSDK